MTDLLLFDGKLQLKHAPASKKVTKTRRKALKMEDVGIAADQQKAGKQGRDDSVKQFSIQPHPTYL